MSRRWWFACMAGLMVATLVCPDALAQSEGSAEITSRLGLTGVSASAYRSDAESSGESASPSSYEAYIPTTPAPTSSSVTDAPRPEDFSYTAVVDVPNPCIRRKYGGNYCSPSAGNNGGGGGAGPAAPPPPSPEEIASIAIDRALALAPEPKLEIAPARVGLTGLESYFWIAEPPRPISATASVPGLTVTARAVPTQFVWDFGEGTGEVTSTAGRPWTRRRPGNISHLYEAKGRYGVAVEVIWSASYQVNGGGWVGIGNFSTADARPYPVREMVALLVKQD